MNTPTRSRFRNFLARLTASRRGSILIFAIGVLAIISIAAVSYVTVVRIDRGSSAAVARQVNYQQQVNTVLDHIRAVLAADLFGNKVVTRSVPRFPDVGGTQNIDAWPAMFEDGEFWDYPTVDEPRPGTTDYTFDTSNNRDREEPPSLNARLLWLTADNRFQIAPQDDAWLASTEPAWPFSMNNNNVDVSWPHITNLRSVYRYKDNVGQPGRPTPENIADDAWVRMDGRFADLGRFFIDFRSGGGGNWGNPGTDLLMRNTAPGNLPALGPQRGVNYSTLGTGVNDPNYTGVYHRQMAQLGPLPGPELSQFTRSDERQWADTDGDLRPDARWTQLESLGNFAGLVWVVAARIIDASALVNINTAIEHAAGSPLQFGDGRTPADIDLARLLNEWPAGADLTAGAFPDYQIQRNRLFGGPEPAFREHIELGLGFGDETIGFFRDITQATPPEGLPRPADLMPYVDLGAPLSGYTAWTENNRLNPVMRAAAYEYFGADPSRPIWSAALGYPQRDLIDLMAFWGTNNDRLVSKAEQRFDGPEIGGYLPGSGASPMDVGPMRSRETREQARRFDQNINNARPTLRMMRYSLRRLLTPVSGVGHFSPVPVINNASGYVGPTVNTKINLRNLNARRDLPRIFEAFVWALAPFATDQPMFAPMQAGHLATAHGAFDLHNYSYGGGTGGAAEGLEISGTNWGSAFAVLTAAQLAVNLIDASDADNAPTVMRLFNDVNIQDDRNTPAIEQGTRLAQGDIPQTTLPNEYVGIGSGGVTIVGVDRHPYIREVVTVAIYSDYDGDRPGVMNFRIDGDPDNPADQLGSVVAFELFNPWPQAIDLTNFRFVIPGAPDSINGDSLIFRLDGFNILPGERAIFFYLVEDDGRAGGAWQGVLRDELEQHFGIGVAPAGVRLDDSAVEFAGEVTADYTADNPVIFQRQSAVGQSVLLMYEIPNISDGMATNDLVLLDRIVSPDRFPDTIDGSVSLSAPTIPFDNLIPQWGGACTQQYLRDLGYDVDQMLDAPQDPRLGAVQITGRVIVTTRLSRPGANHSVGGGFPVSVMGFNGPTNQNVQASRRDAIGWLAPYTPVGLPPGINPPDPMWVPVMQAQPLNILETSADILLMLGGELVPRFPVHGDHWELDTPAKSADANVADDDFPPFQLYIPNRPLGALSELHMLSVYANTCLDHDLDNLAKWETAGEKLARSLAYDFSVGSSNLNPYLGVLDPTRYMPGQPNGDLRHPIPGGAGDLPDHMRIPLALRVFQPFEVLPQRGDLVQGRININTAPAEVLRLLPFVDTSNTSGAFPPAPLTFQPLLGVPSGSLPNRVDLMINYRDDLRFAHPAYPYPDLDPEDTNFTGILGLRRNTGASGTTKAFVSIGELAILDQWMNHDWNPGTVPEPVADTTGFLELGANAVDSNNYPLEIWTDNSPFGFIPGRSVSAYANTDYNPSNDPEERLALFRAVSNLVSTRSDVYLAWFIVRGYSPDRIEQIQVTDTTAEGIATLMDTEEGFRPVYETRWLAVLDRSNIQLPTDRPRVLLLVELPPTTP